MAADVSPLKNTKAKRGLASARNKVQETQTQTLLEDPVLNFWTLAADVSRLDFTLVGADLRPLLRDSWGEI